MQFDSQSHHNLTQFNVTEKIDISILYQSKSEMKLNKGHIVGKLCPGNKHRVMFI